MSDWHLEYSFDVDVENRIIYEKIFGVWKTDTAESYLRDFENEVQELIKKPWAKLIDLSNWKIGTPEVTEIVGRHLAWCRKHNMILSVNVLNNPTTFRQLNQMFAKGGTKKLSHTFRSLVEAEAFLKREGFTLRSGGGHTGGSCPF